MSSLTRIVLTQGEWTDISGEMVSGEKYWIQNAYDQNVIEIAEDASTPTTESIYPLQGFEGVTWKYVGTPVWARPRVIDRASTLGVDIQLIAES